MLVIFFKLSVIHLCPIKNIMKISVLVALFTLSISIGYSQNQNRDREELQTQKRLNLQDRLIIKNGEVFIIQNQIQDILLNQIKLKNGTIVYPDGFMQRKNRERIQLKDGECLGMNGRKYKNERAFVNHVRSKERQMDRKEVHRLKKIQRGRENIQR